MSKPYQIKNAGGAGAAEILIYEQIGADWWSNDGITAKAFAADLKLIPSNQEITVRINSPGGNIHDGLAIHSQLSQRKQFVTCVIDGVAASTAGWIAMAGKKLVMPRNALLMLHNPESICDGDAEEMRQMAATLDAHKNAIITIFTDKTGKTANEIAAIMDAETWMTGDEALAQKFCDEISEQQAINNIADKFARFRNIPNSLRGTTTQTTGNNMSKPNTAEGGPQNAGGGIQTPPNVVTPPAPTHTTPTVVLDDTRLRNIEARFSAQRKVTVTNAVDAAIRESRIPAAQRDRWIERGIADETDSVITDLAAMPPVLPGAAPVGNVTITNEAGIDIGNRLMNLKGRERSVFYVANRARLRECIVNTNTMPAGLQRQAILQEAIEAFAYRLAVLQAFSTVFRDTPLQGTDIINIPYYALQGTASTDWNASNGYVMGNTATSTKAITVDKRKYQAIAVTSSEAQRQPYLIREKLAMQAANKLAYDVVVNILSVVTAANYSTAAHVGTAANFDSADVADIKLVCDQAQWPDAPRSLILDATYENYLIKDTSIKNALNYGGSEAIRDGKAPRIMGFDFYSSTIIPANAENLKGFAVYPSGILVAISPIAPTPEVQSQLQTYETLVHAGSGATFEHRVWGNPDMDNTREVIECNYGFAAGEAAAVKRVTSA